jgi:F-type H+-transporting ATPase subunit gamma
LLIPAGVEAEKTMVVPISSDKGLCGGINTTVVKYSKVVSGLSEEGETSMTIIGEKARGQLSKAYADSVKNVIVDLSKVPLTFATASLVTDAIMAEGAQKHQIIYNRFQSVISFKPTVATVYSSEEYEKAAENGINKFDEYEMEGPERSEFLLDLAEFNMGAVMYNALLENSTSELGSRMQSMENSTKNAKDMLGKLTLLYNRTRQASITTELIEIISGASALGASIRLSRPPFFFNTFFLFWYQPSLSSLTHPPSLFRPSHPLSVQRPRSKAGWQCVCVRALGSERGGVCV